MKRALFAFFAIALIAGSYATPALADDTAAGQRFNIAVVEAFPGTCPTGETMRGAIEVSLTDRGGAGTRKQVVVVQTRAETAFGDVVIAQQTVRVDAGSSTKIPVEVLVPNDTPAGTYTFAFDVKLGADTATVDQTVDIY